MVASSDYVPVREDLVTFQTALTPADNKNVPEEQDIVAPRQTPRNNRRHAVTLTLSSPTVVLTGLLFENGASAIDLGERLIA